MKTNLKSFSRRIDLTSLQLFVAVCELKSIGRAAEREFLSASAVSKRLAELEKVVGSLLLERHSRGVNLTQAGESLLLHSRSVLFGLEKMQSDLDEIANGVRGHVKIHASTTAIVQFLPEDLSTFAVKHERIKIDLEEHMGAEVARAVREGGASIGIYHYAAEEIPLHQDDGGDTHLQSKPYRVDRLVLVVPEGHPLGEREQVEFAEALDYDIVGLHAGTSIGLTMLRAAAEAGKQLKLRIQVSGLDATCRMIDRGMGIGVVPDRAFELMRGMGTIRAIALSDDWAQRELRIVSRDFAALPASARLLVDHLTASTVASTANI